MSNVYVMNVITGNIPRYTPDQKEYQVRDIECLGITNDRHDAVDLLESGRDFSDSGRYEFGCLEKVPVGISTDHTTDKVWYDMSVRPHVRCDPPSDMKNIKRLYTKGP